MNEPRELVFFTDRDLGHQFPERLRASGIRVERHDDHFGPQTPDAEWIREIGRRGWVAVSRDARIRYSPLALSILMTSGARLFVLVGKVTASEAAELFLQWHEHIERLLRKENQPFIAKIRRDGVHMSVRKKEWQKRAHVNRS
jgi:hypothetical protein